MAFRRRPPLEALREFSAHPSHLEAKRQYQRWYRGYHIVIAEIVRSYGDDAIEHFTPNQRDELGGASR